MSWVFLLLSAVACVSRPTLPPTHTPAPAVYHLHLPGIGGDNPVERWWCRQIEQTVADNLRAGPDAPPVLVRSDLYDWTGSGGPMKALQDVDHARAEALVVAGMIAQWRRAHPDTRLILSGASGGAGPAVWALEALPPDVRVDELILVSPALARDYDLSKALQRITGRAHVFASEGDNLILGWGTRTYGTIDRRHVESAGLRGFSVPAGADERLYATKLMAMPYRTEWRRYWNFGGHAHAMSPSFARHVIAPIVARGDSGS
jgi:hypothetical protein